MIPAILTCIFVIYLYQSLKEPADVTEGPAKADEATVAPDAESTASLATRMESLQRRLDGLADGADS